MNTLLLIVLTLEPNLSDRDRFPPREAAFQAIQFNRAYRQHIVNRQLMELHNWWYYQEILNETDYLFHCWDWLHASQGGEGREQTYWISSLARLKELIGEEAYNSGQMPPNVPTWRFTYAGNQD